MPKVKLFDTEVALEKAMMLFWKKGYYNTSIQDLTNYLGISRSSLYDTFGGKKKIFYKALDLYRTSYFDGLPTFLSTQKNVKEGLRLAFQKVITDDCEDVDSKGCFIVNTTTELLPTDSKLHEVISIHKHKVEQAFLDFLQFGVLSGQISKEKDLNTLASLLYTVLSGLRVVGKTKPDQKELMNSVEAVLSLLD